MAGVSRLRFGLGMVGLSMYAPYQIAASVSSFEVPAGGVGSAGFTNTGWGFDTSAGDLLIGDFTNTRVVRTTPAGAYVGEIILGGSPPANSVQGVSYDAGRTSVWVAHYAVGGGSIRRYDLSGSLQQTIAFAAVNGPNGIVYDPVNDYVLSCADDCKVRTYNAATGSLVSTVDVDPIVGPTSSGVTDGIWIDLADTNWLFVSEDNTSSDADRIWRINRQSGAVDRGWAVPEDVESIGAYDGYLWLCCDRFYHSAVANGNRVHKLSIPVTSQSITASSLVKRFMMLGVGA